MVPKKTLKLIVLSLQYININNPLDSQSPDFCVHPLSFF